jgi:hypothetical protein
MPNKELIAELVAVESPEVIQRRLNNDRRPLPGKSGDQICVNLYCPSAFSCRRFSWDPHQGRRGTVFMDGEPDLLDGLLCASFDPSERFFPAKAKGAQ